MAFNPFEHLSEMVFDNLPGGPPFQDPPRATVTLFDGQIVPAAMPGDPSTLSLWLMTDSHLHQATNDQGFAQELWLHYAYGADVSAWLTTIYNGLGIPSQPGYHLTDAALKTAIYSMPTLLATLDADGFTEQQVLAYAHAEVPDVMLVGQAPST
jgi:hypothetical protein